VRGVDLFAGLSDQHLEQIAKVCTLRTYQPDERCAVQGETIDELRIVNGGKVAVEMRIGVASYTQRRYLNKGQCVHLVRSCGATYPYCLSKMHREGSNHLYKGFRFTMALQRKAIN